MADVVDECETVDAAEPSESADFFHLPYDELDEADESDDRDYAPPDPWRKDVSFEISTKLLLNLCCCVRLLA